MRDKFEKQQKKESTLTRHFT